MNFKELVKSLSPLGLEEKETQVLASLFLSGTRSAALIAENAGLKRPHTYNLLQSLKTKGLVQEVEKNTVKHFSPSPGLELLGFLEKKQNDLKQAQDQVQLLIPLLDALQRPRGKKPSIRFFWGLDGLQSIYKETLKTSSKIIYGFCDFEKVFPLEKDPTLNNWMWNYAKQRANHGIVYQGIINRSPTSDLACKTAKEHKRVLKELRNVDLPLEVNIFDDKVAFMSSAIQFMGIMIEDADIATTIRSLHQFMWGFLEDYKL